MQTRVYFLFLTCLLELLIKNLVKSSKIVGSAPKIQFRKNQKNRPSSFELEKCFLKPHSSKTQIALVTRPGGSRRRGPADEGGWEFPPFFHGHYGDLGV